MKLELDSLSDDEGGQLWIIEKFINSIVTDTENTKTNIHHIVNSSSDTFRLYFLAFFSKINALADNRRNSLEE